MSRDWATALACVDVFLSEQQSEVTRELRLVLSAFLLTQQSRMYGVRSRCKTNLSAGQMECLLWDALPHLSATPFFFTSIGPAR